MTPGKAAAQAGHAFLASYIKSPPDIAQAYVADDGGTKVVLTCPDEPTIWQAFKLTIEAGIPCHLWLETDMGESPVVTALGIGPVERSRAKPIVREFKLMK